MKKMISIFASLVLTTTLAVAAEKEQEHKKASAAAVEVSATEVDLKKKALVFDVVDVNPDIHVPAEADAKAFESPAHTGSAAIRAKHKNHMETDLKLRPSWMHPAALGRSNFAIPDVQRTYGGLVFGQPTWVQTQTVRFCGFTTKFAADGQMLRAGVCSEHLLTHNGTPLVSVLGMEDLFKHQISPIYLHAGALKKPTPESATTYRTVVNVANGAVPFVYKAAMETLNGQQMYAGAYWVQFSFDHEAIGELAKKTGIDATAIQEQLRTKYMDHWRTSLSQPIVNGLVACFGTEALAFPTFFLEALDPAAPEAAALPKFTVQTGMTPEFGERGIRVWQMIPTEA